MFVRDVLLISIIIVIILIIALAWTI